MWEAAFAVVIVVLLVIIGFYVLQNVESITVMVEAAVYGTLGQIMDFSYVGNWLSMASGMIIAIVILFIILIVANAIREGGEEE